VKESRLIVQDLYSLAIIWIAVFASHWLAGRTKMTPVLWFLFTGCLLVNIGVLPPTPGVFIKDLSEFGIIIIMFALGFEENSEEFMRSIRRSWGIALFGAIAPFVTAYALAMYFWDSPRGALMCGLAMTATAVSLTMVSLKSEGLLKTSAATGIMTSAVLDDIASLALVAVLVPMATGDTTFSFLSIGWIIAKAALFFLLVTFMAMWLFPIGRGPFGGLPLLNKFNLRLLLTMQEGEHAILTVLLIALLVALLGHELGFHPAVGAYMAGLILKEEYFAFSEHSPEGDITIHQKTRHIIDSVAFSWIGPVFFIVLGTRLVLNMSVLESVIDEILILFIALFIAQVLSAGLAARFTGGFNWAESWLIGFGMLGRAELAFVVIDIAFVQNHVITEAMFYTLMGTAFCLNISVPLMIRWWKPRVTVKAESEQQASTGDSS
jgi:Kef-type K+ transport system membrane component KefB